VRPNDGRVERVRGGEVGQRQACAVNGCRHVLTAHVPEQCEVSLLHETALPEGRLRHVVFIDPRNREGLLAALLHSHFSALRRALAQEGIQAAPLGGNGWGLFSRRARELGLAPTSPATGPAAVVFRKGDAVVGLWLFHIWPWPGSGAQAPAARCERIAVQGPLARLRRADDVVVPLDAGSLLFGPDDPALAALATLDLGAGPALWLCLDDLGALPRLALGLDLGPALSPSATPAPLRRAASAIVAGAALDLLRGHGLLDAARLPAVEVSGLWPDDDLGWRHAGLEAWIARQRNPKPA
jgi:hypothetical protein